MNRVCITGRLTKDVELKKTQTGKSVVNFTVAVNDMKKADGTQVSYFINCQAWEKPAELIAQYFHQGSQIGISGKLTTRSYEKDGRNVYITEVSVDSIDFFDPKDSVKKTEEPQFNTGQVIDIANDDLPF